MSGAEETARLERDLERTIDQRDAAEECLSQLYYIVTGNSPEWSNHFGHAEALEDVGDAVEVLKASARPVPDSARAILSSWMISQGYATGHGDTIEDLLGELKGQIEGERLIARALAEENSALASSISRFNADIARKDEALSALIEDVRQWTDAVSEDSSWDGWDHHYKALAYGGLDKYRAALEESGHLDAAPADQAKELTRLREDITRKDEALRDAESFITSLDVLSTRDSNRARDLHQNIAAAISPSKERQS